MEEKSKQREQFESHPTVGGGGEALRGELNRKMTNLEPALTVFFPQVFPQPRPPDNLTILHTPSRRPGRRLISKIQDFKRPLAAGYHCPQSTLSLALTPIDPKREHKTELRSTEPLISPPDRA